MKQSFSFHKLLSRLLDLGTLKGRTAPVLELSKTGFEFYLYRNWFCLTVNAYRA